ncbi:MAG: anthranilate synthase component I, partial [Planctomycetota bacterium]
CEYDFVPVYRRLFSDTLTPVTAFMHLDDGESAFLIESVIGGEKVGRYSFLATRPLARFTATGNEVETVDLRTGQVAHEHSDDPLDAFRTRFGDRVAPVDGLPPFIGGAIGYAAYDVVRYVEPLGAGPPDDRDFPTLDFAFYHTLCVFDHVDKTITVVSLADCRKLTAESDRGAIDAARALASSHVAETINDLAAAVTEPVRELADAGAVDTLVANLDVQSNFTQAEFESSVRACVEYIRAGDIFQVVPSQRFRVKSEVDPLDVYRSLRVVNPSPFMFFVRSPSCVLVGCSPEIMCRVQDRTVTVRPLAGTRPRGKTEAEDQAFEQDLLSDPKERAEHVMLVDLGRNDIGRIAAYRSVELAEVMVIERYSHVMHISSEVRGHLRDDLDAFDALKSCLPAGTVSGAPKVRAMQVIDELEPHRRGPYGGAIGYVDYRGNMDTCLALRTIVFKDGHYDVQAGCGVVADSNPTAEYEETCNKARAMIQAIALAEATKANR